jgi:hypothetical protein
VQVGDILMLVSGAARFQVPDSRSLFRGVRKILLAGAPISLGAPSHTFFARELIKLQMMQHFAPNQSLEPTAGRCDVHVLIL